MPPALFFFRAALAICDLLWFHTNFRIVFSISVKNAIQNFDRDFTDSIDSFG